jgi:hypothetical protein
MARKLTITIDEDIYRGLHAVIGRGRIGSFVNGLLRAHVGDRWLEAEYRAMAADEEHEREALEWIEGVVSDVADEPE